MYPPKGGAIYKSIVTTTSSNTKGERMMILFVVMLAFCLGIVALSAIIAKRYGSEYMVAVFVSSIILSPLLASKLIAVGSYTIDATIVVFSITFLLTDMLCEFYGKQEATKAVWGGFLALVLAVGAIQLTIALPAASFWNGQDAFVATLGSSWRIVLASMVAYITTQYFDVWLYHQIKQKTKDNYLWLRNNASTMTSQFFNSIIFYSIAFAGVAPLVPLITTAYLFKVGVALLDTPVLYVARWYFRRGRYAVKKDNQS